jgi:hypothetical protein
MSFCYAGWRSVIISWPLMPKPVKPSSVEAPVPAIADFRKALALKDKLYDSHTLSKDGLKRLRAAP